MDPLERRDLIENEEIILLDNTDEAREGEHCYICEKNVENRLEIK